jgi:hypothetical protein
MISRFERMATMRTTDGRLRLLVGAAYWAAVALNRQATRADPIEPDGIRDRARP